MQSQNFGIVTSWQDASLMIIYNLSINKEKKKKHTVVLMTSNCCSWGELNVSSVSSYNILSTGVREQQVMNFLKYQYKNLSFQYQQQESGHDQLSASGNKNLYFHLIA